MSNFYVQYPPSSSSSPNASVGTNAAPIPASSTLVAGEDPTGNLQPLQTNSSGDLLVEINTQTSGLATAANQVLEIADLDAINTKTPALGQAVMASSSPVVIASNQSAVPVSGPLTDTQLRASAVPISATSLPLPSGAATEATLATRASEATLSSFSAKSSSSDVHEAYDYRAFTYVGITQKIDTITYKTGGSGGSTVATQTFGYDGSDRLTSITKT